MRETVTIRGEWVRIIYRICTKGKKETMKLKKKKKKKITQDFQP